MRVTMYNTELSADKTPVLVKERGVNYQSDNQINFTTPKPIVNMMNDIFKLNMQTEEYVYMLCFNTKQKLIGVFEISHGTVNASLASPREMYIRALLCGAVNIILVHNHPSGEITPSKEDKDLTKKVKEAGKIIGITLLDHLIIGEENTYLSLRETGDLG